MQHLNSHVIIAASMNNNEPQPAPAPSNPLRAYLSALICWWSLRGSGPVSNAHAMRVCLGMGLAWLALWIGIDFRLAQPAPEFISEAIPLFAWYVLAILLLAAILRLRSHPKLPFEAMLVLSLGLVPLPLLIASLAVPYLSSNRLGLLMLATALYCLCYLARGLSSLAGSPQRAAALLGVLFVAGFVWATDALNVIPDVFAPREAQAGGGDANANAEQILFDQSARIDQQLAGINRNLSPSPQAFFLGFAGVGEQRVFAEEIALASKVLSDRYGMNGRGLSLVNDERDLESGPLASLSALRYALAGLSEKMLIDRDVLFLAISSHGSKDPAIAVSNSQLPLNDISDEDLAQALQDSGIKWRVIIISACYAGAFINAVKNPQTIVITAAASDRTSFGCSNDRDLTYFGEAFYRDALPDANSLRDAFEKAKVAIVARERREHVDASKPEAYFGAELESKLGSMRAAPQRPQP
jgi:hypothetical protein